MKAELAYFFQQELQFLKKEMKRFAAEDPAARAKLQINEDGDSYADVERLVHGAAFLNARTACRIHEAQTQVYEGLLNALFPHFLAPLPAYSIAEFEPELGAFQPSIPLSKTEHKLHSSGDYPAEFRLLDNAKILPIAIDNLALVGPPYPIEISDLPQNDQVAMLRFRISRPDSGPLTEVDFAGKLRCFIHESRDNTFELLEYLLRHARGVVFFQPNQQKPFAFLPASAITPVGLDPFSDRIIEQPLACYPGYGLLTELFAYPLRFNFFDLKMPDLASIGESSSIEVGILLRQQSSSLEQSVRSFRLRPNCNIVLNLFEPENQPVVQEYDPANHDYPLLVEPEEADGKIRFFKDRFEVIQVKKVEIYNSADDVTTQLYSLFTVPLDEKQNTPTNLYNTRRNYTISTSGNVNGSDVYITTSPVFDLTTSYDRNELEEINEKANEEKKKVLRTWVSVMNRDVNLEGNVTLFMTEFLRGVKNEVRPVHQIYKAIRPYLLPEQKWRLVNHIGVNQVSLLTKDNLKTILSLYEKYESQRSESILNIVNAIRDVQVDNIVERVVVASQPSFVKGNHVTVSLASNELPPGKTYLLGRVLASFLCGFQSINTVTRVTIAIDGKVAYSELRFGNRPSL